MNSRSTATPRNGRFFSNISFRIKIVMGFVAIIALSMIVLSFAYLGYDRVSSGYSSYHAGVGEASIAQTIDHNAAVYRYTTRAYVLTGDEVDAEAAQQAEASLRSAIEGSTATIRSAPRQDIIKGLSAKFDALTALFGQVLQLKRNDFVDAARKIVSEGNTLKQKVEDLGDAAMLSDVASIQYGTKTALVDLGGTLTDVNALIARYSPMDANDARNHLTAFEKPFADMSTERPSVRKRLAAATEQRSLYWKAFDRFIGVSATFDAKISEMGQLAASIADDAASIRDGATAEAATVGKDTEGLIRSTQNIVLMLAVALVALCALLAFFLSRSISQPIVGMCKAMRELAGGNFAVVLPGLGQKNEIGEMAGAVEAFKVQAVAKAEREANERGAQNQESARQRRAD